MHRFRCLFLTAVEKNTENGAPGQFFGTFYFDMALVRIIESLYFQKKKIETIT